jgi:transcriptional pleiotropic regulator of transition state genes
MKATGIVRKVDELGRVVIPIELRRALGMEVRDPVEVFTDDDTIIFKKAKVNCVFCGNSENLEMFKDNLICSGCLEEIKEFGVEYATV